MRLLPLETKAELDKGLRDLVPQTFGRAVDQFVKRFKTKGGSEANLAHPNYRFYRQVIPEKELKELIFG